MTLCSIWILKNTHWRRDVLGSDASCSSSIHKHLFFLRMQTACMLFARCLTTQAYFDVRQTVKIDIWKLTKSICCYFFLTVSGNFLKVWLYWLAQNRDAMPGLKWLTDEKANLTRKWLYQRYKITIRGKAKTLSDSKEKSYPVFQQPLLAEVCDKRVKAHKRLVGWQEN